ncbi:MAG: DUF6270 domain-containing protein [Cellulomonas sp.]|jgi:hypothetical protein|nr:DUF6270 domain-containing protein [Cellulomonas sp.]
MVRTGPMTLRTFVIGSCVSRDTFDYLDPDRYRLTGYLARQSWASVVRPPGPVVDTTVLASPFQRRQIDGALRGDVLDRLDAVGPVDLVLVDLIDERLGLHQLPDGGLVTRSVELYTSGLEAGYADAARLLRFGSRPHRRVWQQGADAVLGGLAERGLADRTWVLAPGWASTSVQGHRRLRGAGGTPHQFHVRSRPYYRTLRRRLGADRLLGTDLRVQADETHRWGLAPYHYAVEVYRALVAQLDAATARL